MEIESCCGIECGKCSYKESTGCTGCANIDEVFWGRCDIKVCCKEKNLQNCGFCSEFPCQTLKEYSYAQNEHGDNGARIEKCKMWCKEKISL